ncbi:MAG: YerC/YecD family TrpR-related protein [Faecousia sp.]
MERSDDNHKIENLCRLLAEIRDPGDIRALLGDLCTAKEIENMAERCYAAKLLLEGKTYNQVMAQAKISSATLSRVSRCVQYGSGYSRLLKPSDSEIE